MRMNSRGSCHEKNALTLCLLGFLSTAHANVSQDLDSFFNGMGYASNVTSPAAFESQAAGFLVAVHSMRVIRCASTSWFSWIYPVTVPDVGVLIYLLEV